MLNNVTMSRLKELVGFVNIIDIRSKLDYEEGHIPTSINIDRISLKEDPSKYLSKDKVYYIYCGYGKNSFKVCVYLNNLGYNTVNVLGGYNSNL